MSQKPSISTSVDPDVRWLKLENVLQRMALPPDEELAWERLSRRLDAGAVRSKAAAIIAQSEGEDADDTRQVSLDQQVPVSTWTNTRHTLVDASSGEVEVSGWHAEENRRIRMRIQGLKLAEEDLLDLLKPVPVGVRPGRPPGGYWPVLAAELALFLHDKGPPSEGTTISSIEDYIFERIDTRLTESPSSTVVRDAIETLLARLRE